MNPKDVLKVFETVEPISVRDPLKELQGLVAEGQPDVVRLPDLLRPSGMFHPMAVAAFRLCDLAAQAIGKLLEGPLVRGEVLVVVRGQARDHENGVMARVFSEVFGAWGEDGFKGWTNHHSRRRLLFFEDEEFDYRTFDVIHWPSGVWARVNVEPEELPYSIDLQNLLFEFEKRNLKPEEEAAFEPLWATAVYEALLSPEAQGAKVYFVKPGHDNQHPERLKLLQENKERMAPPSG